MDEIQSLSAKVERLSGAVDWWNYAIICMMIAAALAATGLLVTQFIAFKRAGQLSSAQVALGKAKEDRFSSGLEAQKQLTIKAQTELAELQKASLPREIDVGRVGLKLQKYAGTRFDVMTISEFEPSHTAALIRQALIDAKWEEGGGSATSGGLPEELSRVGIWIESGASTDWVNLPDGSRGPRTAQSIAATIARLEPAAKALAITLREEGIDANVRPMSTTDRPSSLRGDAVHIYVSLRPFPGLPNDLRVVSHPAR